MSKAFAMSKVDTDEASFLLDSIYIECNVQLFDVDFNTCLCIKKSA